MIVTSFLSPPNTITISPGPTNAVPMPRVPPRSICEGSWRPPQEAECDRLARITGEPWWKFRQPGTGKGVSKVVRVMRANARR